MSVDKSRMTDGEAVKAMFDQAGIVYNESILIKSEIEVDSGDSKQNEGFPGLYAIFGFDEDGALVRFGSWGCVEL